jgi:hypothetical protein
MFIKLHNFNSFIKTNLNKQVNLSLKFIKYIIFALKINENEMFTFFHAIYLFLIEDKIFFKKLT